MGTLVNSYFISAIYSVSFSQAELEAVGSVARLKHVYDDFYCLWSFSVHIKHHCWMRSINPFDFHRDIEN